MRTVMKTHLFLIGALSVLGTSFLTTSYAANTSEYLHFTRHRDSNGNLLMAPTQHQAEPSVMQKTIMPSQPKTFEKRSTDWGMSVNDVKENETIESSWELRAPVLPDYEQRVAYNTQIEGVDAALTYVFYEDHLGQAKYVFEPQHEDAVEYVQDFYTVKNWISQSYGLPTSVQDIWLDDLYQYDESLWGQAVMRGHLVMVAEWKTPGTDIVLVLDGGDDTVGLMADFSSTTYVAPVSFDMQSQEENVEEVIEETTIQEALPAEPSVNQMVEEVPGQEKSLEVEGSGESHPEAEMASQGPVDEIRELQEIEQMLNEETLPSEPVEPAMEGGSMDKGMNEGVMKETTVEPSSDSQSAVKSEVIYPEFMDEHSVDEHLLQDKGMSKDHLIESSVDTQEPGNAMDMPKEMPLEPSVDKQATEAHPADEHAMTEQANDQAMDMTEEMPLEPSVDKQATDAHPADEHAMNEHSDAHAMETESELEPQHHL